MSLTISSRSSQIVQSEIRNMSIKCDRVGGINLSQQGICDLELPLSVQLGAQDAIIQDINHYTRCDGLLELRQAIAEKTIKYNHTQADPEKYYYLWRA